MKRSFYIQPENISTATADLFVEVNGQGFSYIILNEGACMAIVMYKFDNNISDEIAAGNIHQVIADQPVLKQKFNTVNIIYGYMHSILVPRQFINESDTKAMLELVYGEASERITRTDFMQKHSIHNIYGIPAVIDLVMNRYFELARFTHLFSLLPNVAKKACNEVYCIFSTGQLNVMFIKESKLQLMQNYCYKTPEDVAYQLLHLCKSFEVNVDDITVRLSGMIDENSPLFSELYKYFLRLVFDELPTQYQYPEEINKYPAHYFSHLFAVAACV